VKQIAQNYKSGALEVLDVPVPACRPGGVLVRSLYSLISTGTELMKVSEASKSLIGMARSRPDQVRKVLDSVAQNGIQAAYSKAMNQLDSYTPLGYSLCGVVIEVGRGAEQFKIGQLVACAGNEFALHAEVNWVPRNLVVPVPDAVNPEHAAFATVGAIAMHGVRRAEAQLGDTACVVGLGLVGQLAVQLLVASGVRVVGIDPVPERCRLAERAGAVACDAPDTAGVDRLERVLADLTDGLGADHVLLVAGGSSNGPVEAAARLARDRARVVDIGKLKLDLPWNAYYDKELDVRFSRSYGPGRYDDSYELDGIDYPAGYVRWTERRNLQCFIDLLARDALPIDMLVSDTFPIEQATEVYARLQSGSLNGLGVLFRYPDPPADSDAMSWPARAKQDRPAPSVVAATRIGPRTGQLRVGFVGAGNYASTMLLPHLARNADVALSHVVTTSSLSAANARRRFGFAQASTDLDGMLADPEIDAVFVVTRHHSHAELVGRCLRAGKATFVEKPLAIDRDQLDHLLQVVASSGNDRLMVGFNRRFAPLLVDLRARFGESTAASSLRYLVSAGQLGAKSWYRNEDLEGSRFVGEGGHFIDTMTWWFDAHPIEVHALCTLGGRGLHVAVRFDDGSIGTVDYVTEGSPRYPKETIEAAAGTTTARFENFGRATVWHGRRRNTRRAFGRTDKGQSHEIASFVQAVRTGGPMPITLQSLAATTAATLAVEESLVTGAPVSL
jgi:predicted dehydrogenase/threonine dehydrogenase-like Zn-dependent dehydrogenase